MKATESFTVYSCSIKTPNDNLEAIITCEGLGVADCSNVLNISLTIKLILM